MSQTYTGLEVIDRDNCFVVDPLTREISSKNPQKTVLIRNDHNSERFTFEVPRFIEGRDLTLCNVIRVHYRNGNRTGVYTIEDVAPYEFVNDTVFCSWLISQNSTSSVGPLSFMLKFSQVDDEGNVEYAWSTKTYSGVEIVSDIEAPDVYDNEYYDLIEQMKSQVMEELTEYVYNSIYSRGARIPNGSDLNDYTTPGNYYIIYSENAATLVNAPTLRAGFNLRVEQGNRAGKHVFQTAKTTVGVIYRRVYFDGWSDWDLAYDPTNTTITTLDTNET